MAIIRDFYQGPCHIIVHDDSIRPPEEVKKIIDRVSELVINAEIKRNLDKRRDGKDEDT